MEKPYRHPAMVTTYPMHSPQELRRLAAERVQDNADDITEKRASAIEEAVAKIRELRDFIEALDPEECFAGLYESESIDYRVRNLKVQVDRVIKQLKPFKGTGKCGTYDEWLEKRRKIYEQHIARCNAFYHEVIRSASHDSLDLEFYRDEERRELKKTPCTHDCFREWFRAGLDPICLSDDHFRRMREEFFLEERLGSLKESDKVGARFVIVRNPGGALCLIVFRGKGELIEDLTLYAIYLNVESDEVRKLIDERKNRVGGIRTLFKRFLGD